MLVLKTSNSRLNQARNGWPDSTTDTFPDIPLCSSISAPSLLLFQPLIHFNLFLHINWRLYNFALVSTSNFPPLPVSCLWVIALNSEHCPTKNFSSLNFKRKSFEGQYDFRAKMWHLKHIELFWRWGGFEFYKVLLCWKQWGCKIMHNHKETLWLVVLKLCTYCKRQRLCPVVTVVVFPIQIAQGLQNSLEECTESTNETKQKWIVVAQLRHCGGWMWYRGAVASSCYGILPPTASS